jgi:hypothetical protein
MISKTRSHLNKKRRVSRRLSKENILQEGGMNWKTYSKGSREEPIEKILKPLCVELGITNSSGQAECDQLQAYIQNDDVNFPKNIQKKTGLFKKTLSAYLSTVQDVNELIEKLKGIKASIMGKKKSAFIPQAPKVVVKVDSEKKKTDNQKVDHDHSDDLKILLRSLNEDDSSSS